MGIDRWLDHNTFHHGDFRNLAEMITHKRRQGLTISLCIPTLNEEQTIADEVVSFRSALMEQHPLLDEIAVIDSGSSDRTREVAAAAGADVYLSAEILPELGARRGKGENLWKAIYQLRGDVIVYIDADIKNINPRFAYGVIGPLIYRPELKYVKAFYERPLEIHQDIRPSGGGRVTEILVRPLFSLLMPELSALIQPLSGEYAARREVLERIPFPIGYGVETAHLLDIYHMYGLDVFAQTDMDRRVHRNQSTRGLGRMAFGILQTFLSRAQSLGLVEGLPPMHTVLRQFQVREERYEQVEYPIAEEERPPMREVEAYREKFGLVKE